MLLIVMTGAKQSGKTTASNLLVDEYGFIRLRFADALKRMLLAMGLTPNDIDGDAKEKPCVLLGGKTPRWAMQSLGTEWGRSLISDNLWVDILWCEIDRLRAANPDVRIVIDDCRFPNEYKMVKMLGASVWSIRRAMVEPVVTRWSRFLSWFGIGKRVHISELYWSKFEVDVTVRNNAGIGDFVDKLRGQLYLWHPELLLTQPKDSAP
jgi:hypothetical protein